MDFYILPDRIIESMVSYICERCGQTMASASSLLNHRRRHAENDEKLNEKWEPVISEMNIIDNPYEKMV